MTKGRGGPTKELKISCLFGLQTETRNLSSLAVTADFRIQLRVRSYGQDENDSTNKEVEGLPLSAELMDLYSLDKITFLA